MTTKLASCWRFQHHVIYHCRLAETDGSIYLSYSKSTLDYLIVFCEKINSLVSGCFPSQTGSNAESVSMSWRHRDRTWHWPHSPNFNMFKWTDILMEIRLIPMQTGPILYNWIIIAADLCISNIFILSGRIFWYLEQVKFRATCFYLISFYFISFFSWKLLLCEKFRNTGRHMATAWEHLLTSIILSSWEHRGMSINHKVIVQLRDLPPEFNSAVKWSPRLGPLS